METVVAVRSRFLPHRDEVGHELKRPQLEMIGEWKAQERVLHPAVSTRQAQQSGPGGGGGDQV